MLLLSLVEDLLLYNKINIYTCFVYEDVR